MAITRVRDGRGRHARATSLQDTANSAALARTIAKSLAGGRATQDSQYLFSSMLPTWLPPDAPEDTWRVLDLDADALATYSPQRLLELLVDLSPDMSRALFDFLRLCNPDWTCLALVPGTRDPDPRAMALVGDFLQRQLVALHGTPDLVFNRLFLNTWLRGAIFLELVLDTDAQTPLDIATPDPASARFIREQDKVLGPVYRLGQLQGQGFVRLDDRRTIRYIPVDPLPGSPYGRPLAAPAIFAALFFLGILHDIRRVVAQQGYPRLDIAIDFEALQQMMPEDAQGDPEALQAWVAEAIRQVKDAYSKLQPDDAYIHATTISVNRPVGTVDASSLGGITGLIAALERMLIKGLKTMPLLMGMTDGVSEANANRQLEIHLLGIRAIQHLVEEGLEWCLTLLLNAAGIRADVEFRFAENRAAEELRDQQVLQLKIANANALYDGGYADIDEASQLAIGHRADQRRPRVARSGGGARPGQGNAGALVPGSVKPDTATGSDAKAKANALPVPLYREDA